MVPRWLGLFLGRQLLRFCPPARDIENCEGCALRPFCKCAYEQILAARAVERRVWAVLAVCGGAALVYALATAF